jgi:hypothetical protein
MAQLRYHPRQGGGHGIALPDVTVKDRRDGESADQLMKWQTPCEW